MIATRTMPGTLALVAVILGMCLVWSERKHAPVPAASVSPLGEEVKAQSFVKTEEEPDSISATEASPDTQHPANPKLNDAETTAISERMAEVRRLLDALDVTNAKLEMDYASDTHHRVAVRVEAPSVEQLAPIYDLLSKASNEFPEGSEAAKAFRNKAALFLKEIGSSDFKVVVKSTNVATGVTDFKVVQPRAKTTTVKFVNGTMNVSGHHTTSVIWDAGNEFDRLFSQP